MTTLKKIYCSVFTALLLIPFVVSAQEQVKDSQTPLGKSILKILPIIILISLLAWLYNRQTGTKKYLERAKEHMDKLENNTDEIIKELKEIKEAIKKTNS